MTFMQAYGDCIGCGRLFWFNPDRVPSIRARKENGTITVDPSLPREPICRECFDRQNAKRRLIGIPEVKLLPGAYDAQEIA